MSALIYDTIDLNKAEVVKKLLEVVQACITDSLAGYSLQIKSAHHFSTSGKLPELPGWYVILDAQIPMYVGVADNLNRRLNTDSGSRDNFANTKRTSDSARNIIKKLAELGLIGDLRVLVITEQDVVARIGIQPRPLTPRDRQNVEKLIGLFRCRFRYA